MSNLFSTTQSTRRASDWLRTKRTLVSLAALATATMVAISGAPASSASAPPPPTPQGKVSVTGDKDTTQEPFLAPRASTAAAWTPQSSWNTLKYNRFYRTGKLPASTCREPAFPLTTAANIMAYHRRFLVCLNRVWAPKVQAAGFGWASPTIILHENGGYDPYCGRIPAGNQYYCGGSQRIYINWPMYVKFWRQYGQYYARSYAAHTMGHEFGHHLQQRTGILSASWYRQRYVLRTTAAKLEESRRRELQASCFSGVYMGADQRYFPLMSGELRRYYFWMIANMGDENVPNGPRDHGSKRSHNYWTKSRGFTYQNAYTCNTWAASSYYVS
jgi:predicted metalloprotease